MARNTRKSQDPTQAALSAIEEALQMGSDDAAPEAAFDNAAAADEPRRSSREPGPAAAPSNVFHDEPPSVRRRPTAGRRSPYAPSNDDRQSVGQILSALHARPPRAGLYIAAIASAWWVVMALVIGYSRAQADIAQISDPLGYFDLPYFWLFFATLVLPPVLFFTIAAMTRRTQEMRLVSRAMAEVTLSLAEPEGASTDAVVSVSQAIRREVAALGDGIERAIARASELETMVRSEVSALERAYDENELRVRALVDELQSERDAIVSHGTRLREAIGGAHESFSFDVESVTTKIETSLAEATERVNASLTESSTRITDGFLTQAETARVKTSEAANIVLETFSGQSNQLAERLGSAGIEVANALDSRTARLTENMNHTAASLTESMATSMEKLVEAISTKGNEVHDMLAVRLAATEEAIGRQGNEVADRIAADTIALSQRMGENVEEVASRIQRIEQTIDGRTRDLNETLASRTLELARTISEGSKAATEAADNTVAGMAEYFAEKAREIAVTISDRAEVVDQTLGKRALEITENLDSRIQRFEEQVINKLAGVTETIESRGMTLTDSLVSKLDEASVSLVSTSKTLIDRTGDTIKSLIESTDVTLKGFGEQTQQIAHTHEALRENVVGSLEKLSESNRLFKQLLEGVTDTLEPLENAVAKRVGALQNTLENTVDTTRSSVDWIDNQMNELRDISGGVLRDLAAVTQRFEGQGRYISSVAETLSETHGRIDQSLEERREAIEHIVRLLVDRTADIEENFGTRSQQIGERLAAFNQLLQESLVAAEARAQEIARNIVDSTNQISQTISKQHEVIRAGYSEERGRTATALRTTYEESMVQVTQMFNDLHERFSETAREVHDVASEVQASLDQTRVEIKRGVLDLPHETRESADAMRRVVADQLKALAELNEIVSTHAREMELVEPSRSYREDAAAAGGTRYKESVVTELPSARQRAAAPRGEPIEFRRPRREKAEPARRSGPRAVAPPRDERPDDDRSGWLTDLVTNGEDDGREDDSKHTVESLDSLSLDIARMIDHEAAVELWDRHKRGERDIFTRRLYTAQGQKTFDEIRRRYQKSSDFRDTVDRYIDEFERLLEQVSRDDRGQALSKTYLTSDTGKVYTLLAHAAARLN